MPKRTVWSLAEAREALERLIGVSLEWCPLDRYLTEYLVEPSMRATVLASTFAATLELVREGHVEVKFLNGLKQKLAPGEMTFILPGGNRFAPAFAALILGCLFAIFTASTFNVIPLLLTLLLALPTAWLGLPIEERNASGARADIELDDHAREAVEHDESRAARDEP